MALALVVLAGCGGGAGDRPTTPAAPGYLELRRVIYGDAGAIVGVTDDPTAAPILRLWDQPGRQANLVGAVLATYYFPVPGRFGTTQTTWAGSPRAAFDGTWSGAMAPGDSIVLPVMGGFDGLPDTVFSSATGWASARWERVGAIDVAHVGAHVVVLNGAAAETLNTYWTLGRVRTGFEQF